MKRTPKILLILFLFVFAIGATFYLTARQFSLAEKKTQTAVEQKTTEVMGYIDRFFVDSYDEKKMADAACEAMVSAGTDAWSFYLPADEVDNYEQSMSNSYVGIGVTIEADEQGRGLLVSLVSKGNAADKAGIRAGDIITEVEGKKTVDLGVEGTRDIVCGEPGTDVSLVILRDKETIELTITREVVQTKVAELIMLNPKVAYIKVENFDDRCAEETLQCIDTATRNGAEGIIFDLRFNPGGYMEQLVEVLDVLLPEGQIIKAVDYAGSEETYTSDAEYLPIPMAVLVNEYSFSAAEFFAAALQEYDRATIVGTATTGKGNFQNHFVLSDGSMLNLSVGKYYTPHGNSLSETGVQPDVEVALSEEQMQLLYQGQLQKKDDLQLQKAFTLVWDAIT